MLGIKETLNKENIDCLVKLLQEALDSLPYYEKRIGETLAEYFVANKLFEIGFKDIWISNKGPDIRVKIDNKEIRIEVKSTYDKAESDGSCAYSFSSGKQLEHKEFNYLICIYFYKTINKWNKKIWVISFDELNHHELLKRANNIQTLYKKGTKEAKKKAREWADYPDTNSCLLYIHNSLEKYEKEFGKWKTKIEIDLHKRPENYIDRWDKIQKCLQQSG